MVATQCNNGQEQDEEVKLYVIIKGGFSQSLRSLTKGGRGGKKSEKLPYVIYERPLSINLLLDLSFTLTILAPLLSGNYYYI